MQPFGVYVHIPFCARRCDYCDFATWTDRAHLMEAYALACISDLHQYERTGEFPLATSVFFGGGTPSLLPVELLTSILAAVPRHEDAEVTLECNPDAVDPDKLSGYRASGVTRLSFGVQSMRSHVLTSLGRTHDPDNVTLAIAWARAAGFDEINVDLIYGADGESLDDWRATLEAVLELDPPHVSAYALTIEPGTPLARRISEQQVAAPDDDDQADKYRLTEELLGAAGLRWYEISNWARPGSECRHNRLYWGQGEYLGIGCAAHGYTGGERWWNLRTPDRYIEAVEQEHSTRAGSEVLDDTQRAQEAFLLALRMSEGAVLLAHTPAVEELVDADLIQLDNDRVVLTLAGRLLANEVTACLLK